LDKCFTPMPLGQTARSIKDATTGWNFALGTNDFPEISLTMSVYPNPTTIVNLSIANYNSENINYQLLTWTEEISNKILQKKLKYPYRIYQMLFILTVSDNNKSLKPQNHKKTKTLLENI
jgi:hypothetical protein